MILNKIKINDTATVTPGVVYDISKATGRTYGTLADALGTDGNNVPPEVREGGMSIRFVQNSDNKYVQYRLMSDTFNTTSANWQGVDDVPTTGSDNLIKSGGNAISKAEIITGLGFIDFTLDADRAYYSTSGAKQYDAGDYARTLPIEVSEGEVITYRVECNTTNCVIAALDSNGNFVAASSVAGTTSSTSERTYTVPSGIKYLVFCNRYVRSPYVAKQGKFIGDQRYAGPQNTIYKIRILGIRSLQLHD